MKPKPMDPKEHIQNIRKKYTGENTTINSDGKIVVGNLTEMLTKTIKELAKNIYKTDSHFIMELIQNADDNEYKPNIVPTLKIYQNDKRIIFQNNEIGFNKENIESICSISDSTKKTKNGLKGYIGEKGIGFKSVFRVSDEPEIYSNGYQFKFNSHNNFKKKEKKLGYILPEWIDSASEIITNKYTNIVLPFKDSLLDKEKKKLTDIKPDLLLFLNKLKRIEITNEVTNNRISVSKTVIGNVVSLKQTTYNNEGTLENFRRDYFLIDRNNIKVPNSINVEQREGINKTRIILAFPLDNKSKLKSDEEMFVYSYLPINKSGFRFLIQADFILTSGRESIDEDNPWNSWIRDEITETFKYAIENFKKHPEHRYNFLNFIPYSSEKFSDFFNPLATELITYCQNSKVVLSESNCWVRPYNSIYADNKQRELFENVLLKSSLNQEYVNFFCDFSESLCDTLGIDSFSNESMYGCLENYSHIKKKDIKWFFDLFSYLGLLPYSQHLTKRISEIPIIPIQSTNKNNQILVCSKDSNVFYPLDQKSTYSFETSINLLSIQLYAKIKGLKNKNLKGRIFYFLNELRIQNPRPYTIIKNYILKKYETDEWKKCNSDELKDHICYIIKYWYELKKHHQELIGYFSNKNIIRCKDIGDGINYYSVPNNVYISSNYGNTNSLEKLFYGIHKIWFIHECYKGQEVSSKEIKRNRKNKKNEWYAFFKVIGCKELPDIPFNTSNRDLTKIIDTGDIEKISQLIGIINNHWNDYKKQLFINKTTKSEWYKKLSENKVIPIGKSFFYAKDIYIKNEKTTSFFGNNVTYFPKKILPEFAEKLGFNTNINSGSIVSYLKHHSVNNLGLTKENANKLYKYLWKDDVIGISDFKNFKLIYLVETGRWYRIDELLWSDYQGIFCNTYGYCEKSYSSSYYDFFVRHLGVKEKPDVTTLISALDNMRRKVSINIDKQKIYKIFVELGVYSLNPNFDEKILKGLNQLIWTNKGVFWTNEGDIFYNDDNNLFELFKNENSIAFFDIPQEYLPKTKKLLDILNIQPISESVKKEFAGIDSATLDIQLTNKLRSYSDTIISWIYSTHILYFEQNSKIYFKEKLQKVEIFESPELQVTYSLNDIKKLSDALSFHSNSHIYLSRDNRDKISSAAFELAGLLELQSIVEFILILFSSDQRMINFYIRQKNITPPPEELLVDKIEQEEYEYKELTKGEDDEEINSEDSEYIDVESEEITKVDRYQQPVFGNEKIIKSSVWKPEIHVTETTLEIEQYQGSDLYTERPHVNGRTFNKSDFGNSTPWNRDIHPLSQTVLDAIGEFGEEKVYFELKNRLIRKYHNGKSEEDKKNQIFKIFHAGKVVAELRWLNFKNLVQEGYDLILEENGIKKYYEVKTTTSDESVIFSISYQQWQFIKEKKENYSIMRVLYAGTRNIKLKEINNPYQLWKDEKLKAFPVNIELV